MVGISEDKRRLWMWNMGVVCACLLYFSCGVSSDETRSDQVEAEPLPSGNIRETCFVNPAFRLWIKSGEVLVSIDLDAFQPIDDTALKELAASRFQQVMTDSKAARGARRNFYLDQVPVADLLVQKDVSWSEMEDIVLFLQATGYYLSYRSSEDETPAAPGPGFK